MNYSLFVLLNFRRSLSSCMLRENQTIVSVSILFGTDRENL